MSDKFTNIDNEKIKYDLYLNCKTDLSIKNFKDESLEKGYDIHDEISVFRYIYYCLFYDCRGLFKKIILIICLKMLIMVILLIPKEPA